ncbi:hypothetical protein [Alloactinosynnema sp. L-07]|uniref:hypothetical protein n=1 Tax=Alloactinosynnema sp. L-07 TaxID=1653480 RepID=UPI0006B5F620|nr:hypothetical protein [Alloactinosynnema sp. L-07]
MALDHREAAACHAARARELLVEAGDVPEQILQRATVEALLAVFHQLRTLDGLDPGDLLPRQSTDSAVGSGAGAGDHVAG